MNPIIVAAIMAVITELMKNCVDQRAENIKAHLNSPGPIFRLRFEGALRRRLNLSPSDWRANKDKILGPAYAEGQAVSLEDAQELLEMAKTA
jgi:hypothetical protein